MRVHAVYCNVESIGAGVYRSQGWNENDETVGGSGLGMGNLDGRTSFEVFNKS